MQSLPRTNVCFLDRPGIVARVSLPHETGLFPMYEAVVCTATDEITVRNSDGLKWFSTPSAAEAAALTVMDEIEEAAAATANMEAALSGWVLKPTQH